MCLGSLVCVVFRETITEEKQLICGHCPVGHWSDQFRIFLSDFVIYMEII